MRKTASVALVAGLLVPSLLLAADAFDSTPKKFVGGYLIYSGELGDWAAPTAKDAKLYLEIQGDAAKKIFAQMPKVAAGGECDADGAQVRASGDLQCMNDAGQVTCFLGYDIKKKKSAPALIC